MLVARAGPCALLWTLLGAMTVVAAPPEGRAEYIGGTAGVFPNRAAGRLIVSNATVMTFDTKSKSVEVPYARIHLLEYGQKVDRRYLTAMLISPLFLLAKSRKHFLTVGYTDSDGQAQALIFQLSGGDVRRVLVSLEARTGRKVRDQDGEARKAGKG